MKGDFNVFRISSQQFQYGKINFLQISQISLIFYKAEPGQIKFAKMGRPETLYVLLLLIDMLFVLFSKAIFSKTVGEGDVSNISSFCVFSENFSVAFIFKT